MSNVKLSAVRELIIENHLAAARAVLKTMPTSGTARKWLNKLNELQEETVANWEYIEVYVKASERLLANAATVMDERRSTTVDHYYSRILNEYGADGWELISEELEGGDYYRLLFKRPCYK